MESVSRRREQSTEQQVRRAVQHDQSEVKTESGGGTVAGLGVCVFRWHGDVICCCGVSLSEVWQALFFLIFTIYQGQDMYCTTYQRRRMKKRMQSLTVRVFVLARGVRFVSVSHDLLNKLPYSLGSKLCLARKASPRII